MATLRYGFVCPRCNKPLNDGDKYGQADYHGRLAVLCEKCYHITYAENEVKFKVPAIKGFDRLS